MKLLQSFLVPSFFIDLQTEETVVLGKNGNVLFQEPALLVQDIRTQQILASGSEALQMRDRLSPDMIAVPIVHEGRVATLDGLTQFLLLIKKKLNFEFSSILLPPASTIVVPWRCGDIQRRTIENAYRNAGMKSPEFLTHGQAVTQAILSPREFERVTGVLYIGYDYSDLYVMKNGRHIVCTRIDFSELILDQQLQSYVLTTKGFIVSQSEIRMARKQSATLIGSKKVSIVRGINRATGQMISFQLTSKEIETALLFCSLSLVAQLHHHLRTLGTSFFDEIEKYGLWLAGTGCEVDGIEKFLSERLQIPVHIVQRPKLVSAIGAYQVARKTP